jgi:ribosomal protein S18 acetylase RimI-like enzyme
VPRITVETASPEDLDVVMTIWSAANATRRRPAGQLRTARVREKLESGEVVLLAHYGDRPAGMALAETFVDGGSADPSTGHISMVFVDPAVWGSGVGTKLLRDLQARWPRLSVWTRTDNRRATRLYLAAGFTDSGNRSWLQDGEEIMQFVWG